MYVHERERKRWGGVGGSLATVINEGKGIF